MFAWLNKKEKVTANNKKEVIQGLVKRFSEQYPVIKNELKVVSDYWQHDMTEREHAMTDAKIKQTFKVYGKDVEMVSHFYVSDCEKRKITSSTIAEFIENKINPFKIIVSFLYKDSKEFEGKRLSYDINIKELLDLSTIDAFYANKVLATISYISYLIVMNVATSEFKK